MKIHQKTPHLLRLLSVFSLIGAISVQALFQSPAYAAQITKRSLTLQANGSNGGSAPGVAVNHKFSFTLPGGSAVGSVKFEYCTTAADVGTATCQTPPGMSALAATFSSTTGITDYLLSPTTTANSVILKRPAANVVAANLPVEVTLNSVTNPRAMKADGTTPEQNYTFYVRISTYASTDGTGTSIDKGTVTASTADPVKLTGTMPESLVFCTGRTVPFKVDTTVTPNVTTTVPDCVNATSASNIQFNRLFDPISTAYANSQMAASTNAGFGYAITVHGQTLMSGTNQINPMIAAAASFPGTSQFGLNLKANSATVFGGVGTDPDIGLNVSPVAGAGANGEVYRGQAVNGYDLKDQFKFVSNDTVADSKNGYVEGSPGATAATDGQIFTATYIANVPGSQPAGDYSTTLTYICTPTY